MKDVADRRVLLALLDSWGRYNRALDQDLAHPVQLVPFLIFHEGYHHGQIKLALKAAGCPILDDDAGPLVWDVWRTR